MQDANVGSVDSRDGGQQDLAGSSLASSYGRGGPAAASQA